MVYQGTGKRQPLLHTSAEVSDNIIGTISQVDPFKYLLDTTMLLFTMQGINGAEKLQVLFRCEVKVERAELRHIPQVRWDFGARHTFTHDAYRAARRAHQAHQHTNERGFTGAIRTNQPVGLAREDGHIEVINCSEFTKLLDELLDPHHGFTTHLPLCMLFFVGIRNDFFHILPPVY